MGGASGVPSRHDPAEGWHPASPRPLAAPVFHRAGPFLLRPRGGRRGLTATVQDALARLVVDLRGLWRRPG